MEFDKMDARSLMLYDKETGVFTRLTNHRSKKIGDVIGCVQKDGKGRLSMTVPHMDRYISAHRVAFLFVTGKLPKQGMHVDHINGNALDNRCQTYEP